MEQPDTNYLTIRDIGADDTIQVDDNAWVVTMVTDMGIWLKHKVAGYSWIMQDDEFNMACFEPWDGHTGSNIKVLKDEA